MATIDVKDAAGATVAIEKPLVPGRANAATSRPVAISNEDFAELQGINAKDFATQATLAAVSGKLPAAITAAGNLKVALLESTAAQAVTGTFWQATQPVSGTFWQATQPVSGTFFQATQPVSAASLPLPTGAATEATADRIADAAESTDPVPITSVDLGTTASAAVTNPATNASLISYVRGWLTGLGAVADTAWTSGSGSVIAILKTIAGWKVGLTYTDASIANASGASETVAAASATRTYLMIANPSASVSWWINPSGAAAVANTAGSFELPPGASWTPRIPPVNIVKGIATVNTDLTVVSA